MPAPRTLRLIPGATSSAVLLMRSQWVYKTLSGIDAASPAVVRLDDHGLGADWLVWLTGVRGADLNRIPGTSDPYWSSVGADAGTLLLNNVDARNTQPVGGRLIYHPPRNLTGAAAVLRLYQYPTDTTAAAELSIAAGDLVNEGAGILRPQLASAPGFSEGWFDLVLTLPGGNAAKVASGPLTIGAADEPEPAPIGFVYADTKLAAGTGGTSNAFISADSGNAMTYGSDGGLFCSAAGGEVTADLVASYEDAKTAP